MKLIITGRAGFIGGNFIHYMLWEHLKDEMLCLDKLMYLGNLETLVEISSAFLFHFVWSDIADHKAGYQIFEGFKPDVVVNFAAESHVDRSLEGPEVFLETNIIGTSVLIDACRKFEAYLRHSSGRCRTNVLIFV